MEAEALDGAGRKLGLAVVSMDRAGIGLSDFKKFRALQTAAEDAHQLAGHLKMKDIVLVGTSGAACRLAAPAG